MFDLSKIGLIVIICGIAYLYYNDTQNKIKLLVEENSVLTYANQTNLNTIQRLQDDMLRTEIETNNLRQRMEQAEEYQRGLISQLQRHNLVALALARPGLIETRINDATEQLFKDFSDITAR
jgi:hypothetical protein